MSRSLYVLSIVLAVATSGCGPSEPPARHILDHPLSTDTDGDFLVITTDYEGRRWTCRLWAPIDRVNPADWDTMNWNCD